MNPSEFGLSYLDSGVNIAAGNRLVEQIKPLLERTRRAGAVGGLGGFAALFELPPGYRQPLLVSATDGVGTKLLLAQRLDKHDTVGIDLVAMCVNDILVSGAEPLYFLDYFASGRLDPQHAMAVLDGITQGCLQAGCTLSGGETAELPGMYTPPVYDLAGFAVGVVEKSALLSAARVQVGDVLLGLASSGVHANGFSLIRQVLAQTKADLDAAFDTATLGEVLLTPTRIYVRSILALLQQVPLAAVCHVTGGGLRENLPRVLPPDCVAKIDCQSWPRPSVFTWLQQRGRIDDAEMLRTFNCGIGLVVCLHPQYLDAATKSLEASGEHVYKIGTIEPASGAAQVAFV